MFTLNLLILGSGGILVSMILYNLISKGSYTAPYDRETKGERFEKKWNHFHSNNGCKWKSMGSLTKDQKKFMNNFLDL